MKHPLLRPAIEPSMLRGSMKDFQTPVGDDLLARTQAFLDWQDARRRGGLWALAKSADTAPVTECEVRYDNGMAFRGVNLASQDYLSLSSHPRIKEAAMCAMESHGVHSAGSPALLGKTSYSLQLEKRLAEFLGFEHCTLFATGWAAGYSLAKGLVQPDDHVVLDALAHSCLREGAHAATSHVHFARHNDVESFAGELRRIRATDTAHAVLVITESLFSMDSDVPDLRGLSAVCRSFNATFAVDVAHDLGSVGEDGTGNLGAQRALADVDLVMGSFSKTFASNGGFILTHRRSVKEHLNYFAAPHLFSNALSPLQAAVVLAALGIVCSDEGVMRRRRLAGRVSLLRRSLEAHGFTCLGTPSPIVPVVLGEEGLGRVVTRELADRGVVVNLVEYPGVPRGSSRLRLQVMADHSTEDIARATRGIVQAWQDARRLLDNHLAER
jgi:glycine C-acetyltransferase